METCIFWGEVGTHRPKACVSAVGKAEEETCYGGTFESWLKRCILPGFWLKFGRTRPKACVSAEEKAEARWWDL